MSRDFKTVYDNIMAVAPERLAEVLKSHVHYWAPQIAWLNLSLYVQRFVIPSSSDPQAIAIYAELCGLSLSEMKARFEEDGL